MKSSLFLLTLVALMGTAGCTVLAPSNHVATYSDNNMELFAYDLGRTHAGIARCEVLSAPKLAAHLESAHWALNARATGVRRQELNAAFAQGLGEPAGWGQRLHISCDCVSALANESRLHNLALFREGVQSAGVRR